MTTTLRPTEALFHVSVKRGQRSQGRSAVAAAAYRSGERLEDRRTGRVFDYRRKSAVVDTLILAPPGAPDWTQDRGALWSRVELAERRKDAQTWTEIEVSIPRDLPRSQWRAFAAQVAAPYVAMGAVVDVAAHAPRSDADGQENGHIHMMISPRALDAAGPQGFAARKLPILARPDDVTDERERIATIINDALRAVGSQRRADHRSYAERQDGRMPEPPIGEREMARWRRQQAASRRGGPPPHPSRRLRAVAAVRTLKREQNKLLEQEVAMAKEIAGISKIPFAQPKQEIKDRLLRERFPDLDMRRAGIAHDAIYRVDVSKADTTRVLMRDDSICEIRDGRVLAYGGTGAAARQLAAAVAAAQGWPEDVVQHLPERVRAAAPKGRYRRREDRAAEIERLVQAWQERGYTDVTTCKQGVWIALGAARILDSGDKMTLHGPVSDDALKAMVEKAAQEWGGKMEIFGDDDFKNRIWLAAHRHQPPVEIGNYTPPDHILAQLAAEQRQQERHQAAVAAVSTVADRATVARELQAWLREEREEPPSPELAAAVGALSKQERQQIASAQAFEIIPKLAGWQRQGEEMMAQGAAVPVAPKPQPQDDQPAPPTGPRMGM